MENKFDSIKLWESLLKWGHLGIAKEAIELALTEQGFKFDGEHIVPLTQETFKIEKGKWYMCIKDYTEGCHFTCGKVYKCESYWSLLDDENTNVYFYVSIPYKEYFRPATEEEIAAQSYNPFDDFRKSDTEKLEPKQETPDIELTEFEIAVLGVISDHNNSNDSIEKFAKRNANRLLSIARKMIIEELKEYKIHAPLPLLPNGWIVGVRDCISKLEEGGNND